MLSSMPNTTVYSYHVCDSVASIHSYLHCALNPKTPPNPKGCFAKSGVFFATLSISTLKMNYRSLFVYSFLKTNYFCLNFKMFHYDSRKSLQKGKPLVSTTSLHSATVSETF